MRMAFVSLIFLIACILFLGAVGKNFPLITAEGLQWDHTVSLAKIQSEENIAIEREETVRFLGLLAASAGIVFIILRLLPGILVLFRRQQPEIPLMLLPVQRDLDKFPQADLEIVDGEWCVVLPEDQETGVKPYFPAVSLLGEKREAAIALLEDRAGILMLNYTYR